LYSKLSAEHLHPLVQKQVSPNSPHLASLAATDMRSVLAQICCGGRVMREDEKDVVRLAVTLLAFFTKQGEDPPLALLANKIKWNITEKVESFWIFGNGERIDKTVFQQQEYPELYQALKDNLNTESQVGRFLASKLKTSTA